VISDRGSDSAMVDNTLEFMYMSGMDLPLALMVMIPEPWKNNDAMKQEKKDFYHYYATMMEPWDGPAAIAFSDGVRIGACMHVTTETANLMRALVASGAQVALCASNPLSTQDDTAASLVRDFGIDVHAIAGEDAETYNKHIDAVVATDPQIIMDDGADLDTALHTRFTEKLAGVIGGTEETTTGVVRLAAMAAEGTLGYPVFNINDANTKHCFDNHYGTGQSTLDGIVRATNRLLCGRTIVISGYGHCGSGLALRAKGMGMDVIICEVDPLKALEAHMEGYRVMPAAEAARFADVWVTVTGNCKVVDEPAFKNMKDGAIICNSGHFDSEINLVWLEEHAVSKVELKPLVEEYTLPDGRTVVVLAQGRLVNLSCAEGHPASVMDMSFANQALAAEYLYQHADELEKRVYDVPAEIDDGVARVKLQTLGVDIDTLTDEQIAYMNSWNF
jgi:adenosylhomocysteinase